MSGKGTAAVSAAALAAAAALAGTASAQDQAQPSADATTPAAPASTTPAPATTPAAPQPQPDGTTDLGTLEVQVPAPPKSAPKSADQQRREGAKRFLKEERKAQKDQVAQEQQDIASSPLAGLDNPLAVPPPEGVPNVTIDSFRIPPFLLPIYQAAGVEYGVRWEVLAAINEIETDYGRNLSVSTAGAVGWMQFMPGTWETYGVDANNDGRKDPYNPVDAIFAAARYLRAAGAGENLQQAIFAYNHADWYVQDVLRRARTLAALPADVVGALSGLTMGRYPVLGESSYADGFDAKASRKGQATVSVAGTAGRRGARITTEPGAAAIAVQDGRVVRIGSSRRLGRFIRVRDVYGNTYTYGHLGSIAAEHVVPRKSDAATTASAPESDPKPTAPATAGRRGAATSSAASASSGTATGTSGAAASVRPVKERLFADPTRPGSYHAGGERQLKAQTTAQADTPKPLADGALGDYLAPPYGLRRNEVALLPLKEGSRVIAGTILGRVGEATAGSPNMRFEIRPAGSGAPRIDPAPILDGWKLLASTQVFRAQNPMLGGTASGPTIGQILLMSKEALERRVLANPAISIYGCGRQDIRAGIIDRRVLATLEFLAANDLKPTVTALECGHGYYTSSGNVSEHSSGDAVDIAQINGTPILGHQGAGSITDVTVRRLLTLQGTMKPHQIITLMEYPGTDNTLALADHNDHIHVGFRPLFGTNPNNGKATAAILQPGQWSRLIGRLGAIQNPTVPLSPSKYSVTVKVKLRKKG